MEENTNWKPNEQGGANNANDWRPQLEPELRKKVLSKIVGRLKELFPMKDEDMISDIASKFEEKTYSIAKDKNDYIRKLSEKMHLMEKTYKNVRLGSSVNGANTPDPAAQVVMNQARSLPTSLPYTQTPTSQKWLPQNTQSNLNIPGSSRLPTQVPITVSTAQNVNNHIGEGVHINILPSQREMQGRQQHLPQQQQPQQYQMNQHLLKEKICHGNLQSPHMQQQAQPPQQQHHPQSLLKQPIQLSSQSSALSSLPSSGQQTSVQQNSLLLPIHQLPTQRVSYSPQLQIVLPSQEHKQLEQEKLISQLMNVPNTQQNHPTSGQNTGQQQGAFRVSSSQQNNIASFQAMPQHNNNNLQNMPQQRLNNASALPSQEQQNMLDGQSGNFNAPGLSLLGTQGQEVGQSQPMMSQQYRPQYPMQQQPQNRSSQQHLDSVQNDTQRFQAASSLHQTQNIANQQNHPHQSQGAPLANPSTSQDFTCKTVNATGDWQEETYQKIKAMKEMHLPVLSTILHKLKEKLRQIESLPPQKMVSEPTEKLKAFKSSIEQVMVFLNVHRSSISERHRDNFSLFKEHILRLTKNHTMLQRSMQKQQGQFPPSQIHQTTLQSQSPQVHMLQSLEKDQMNSRSMSSNHNGASSSVSCPRSTSHTALLRTRPKLEPRDENNIMASSGNVMLPSLQQNPASNPQPVHLNISSVQSSMFQPKQQKQFHHRQIQQPLFHRQQQQQQQQPQQENQQLQIPNSHQTNEINDVLMRQGDINAGLLQQHLSSSQCQLPKPLSNVSLSAASPQIQHHSSPQLVDQQIPPATVNKTGTSSKCCGSPSVARSPIPRDAERPISVESTVSDKLGTQEHVPFSLPPESITERPIDRLIKAFQSASPKSLAESVSEISSIISMVDRIAGSFHPGGGSRAGLGEDLSERTKFRFQTRNLMTHRETNPTKRLKRLISTLPRDIASQTESDKQLSSLESEVDSTESSGSKVNNIAPGCALLQEIREINGRLVETMVEICEEDTSGTIVTCSYTPVALSASFKDHYMSGKISQIQPLRLLVPANYPYSSPIHLEEISFDTSVHKDENLCARTRSRFGLSMKELSEPVSLKEIVQTWNDCARATMVEYAKLHGGGTFSSKYGAWETVLRAS